MREVGGVVRCCSPVLTAVWEADSQVLLCDLELGGPGAPGGLDLPFVLQQQRNGWSVHGHAAYMAGGHGGHRLGPFPSVEEAGPNSLAHHLQGCVPAPHPPLTKQGQEEGSFSRCQLTPQGLWGTTADLQGQAGRCLPVPPPQGPSPPPARPTMPTQCGGRPLTLHGGGICPLHPGQKVASSSIIHIGRAQRSVLGTGAAPARPTSPPPPRTETGVGCFY